MKFYIVDAFTDTVFNGNPAGVVMLPTGAPFPEDEVMRKTAAELRYSETAFVQTWGPSEYQIRYFTPTAEVDLCGHATIAAFWAMKEEGLIPPGTCCVNHTLAGDLEIQVEEDQVLMEMGAPVRMGALSEADIEELCRIMGIDPEAIPKGLQPEIISTGLPDLLLPLDTEDRLNNLRPDLRALSDYSARRKITGVHAFVQEPGYRNGGTLARCRDFAPLFGIDEEAATGTASGALAYYFYGKGILAENDTCRFIQGEAMDRPSQIMSKVTVKRRMPCQSCGVHETVCIFVGGRAAILAKGEIFQAERSSYGIEK